jgi:iron(III) transport system substrate-binding protein
MPGVPFSVLQGAKDEGALNFYSLRIPASTGQLLSLFKKDFPFIKVTQYQNSSVPLYQRFLTEAEARKVNADVIQAGAPDLMSPLVKDGYIANYTITSAADYKLSANEVDPGYWYPFGLSTRMVLLYNPKTISTAEANKLADYKDLWSGTLQGHQLTVPDATIDATGQILYYYIQKTYGNAGLQKLAAVKPLIETSTSAAQSLVSGATQVALMSESIAAQTIQGGAPVQWVAMNPSLVEAWPQAVSQDAPHPDAARLFQEFTFSAAAQSIYQETGLPSLRTGITAEPDYATQPWFSAYDKRVSYNLDISDLDAKTSEVITAFKNYFLG